MNKIEPGLKPVVCLILLALPYLSFGQIDSMLKREALSKGHALQDIEDCILTDQYRSNNILHSYFQQSFNGIPILDTEIGIHNANGMIYSNFNIVQKIDDFDIKNEVAPTLSVLLSSFDIPDDQIPNHSEIIERMKDHHFEIPALSSDKITFLPWYYRVDKKTLSRAWSFKIVDPQTHDEYNIFIDASNGTVLREIPLTFTCGNQEFIPNDKSKNHCDHMHNNEPRCAKTTTANAYTVFSSPKKNPYTGNRTVENAPWLLNSNSSPFGWHHVNGADCFYTNGNNVDVYEDEDNTNSPTDGDGSRAFGGQNLIFDYPWSFSGPTTIYQDAAITNVFYWTNICHDVLYNYGFDEASGNFQQVNYSNSGLGGDRLFAEVQDNGFSCTAKFTTPVDGENPRMQLYTCNENGMERDGAFDHEVIIHEYGHGVSKRLTGGPSNSNCLNNDEQMGEGWSDFLGLLLTMDTLDLGSNQRGYANWLIGQNANGPGIRRYPYSTDMAVNPMTYDTIKLGSVSVPHGVGSVWATMLWELTWGLIDEYGFDPDFYNGTGGNNVALNLIIEALKLQPCSPGFIDGRNAILAADEFLFGGANKCLIWKAFAKRGLGFNASQGSSASRSDGVESYDLPASCVTITSLIADKIIAAPMDTLSYQLTVQNGASYDLFGLEIKSFIPDTTFFLHASDGGTHIGSEVVWPIIDLPSDHSVSYSFEVIIDSVKKVGIYEITDDVENGNSLWNQHSQGATQFVIQSDKTHNGNFAWFANNSSNQGVAYLDVNKTIGVDSNSMLTFYHFYNTETNWDGGQVFISKDLGVNWDSAESLFVQNGYNGLIGNIEPGFSGYSGDFVQSKIDLSAYAGESVTIRFQMNCDQVIGDEGWYIDDIHFTDINHIIDNKVNVSYNNTTFVRSLFLPTSLEFEQPLSVSIQKSDVSCGAIADGEINLSILGGKGVVNLIWNNGASDPNLTNLQEGVYSFTLSDLDTVIIDSVEILNGLKSMVHLTEDVNQNGSLRYYLESEPCPNDTIIFHHTLMDSTIQVSDKLEIKEDVNIIGLGMDHTIIDGGLNNIIFLNPDLKTLSIQDLTLKNGHNIIDGGAILNLGVLNLENTKFSNNFEGLIKKAFTNKASINIDGQVIIEE